MSVYVLHTRTKRKRRLSRLQEIADTLPRDPVPISIGDTDLCKLIWVSVIYQSMSDIVCTARNTDALINRAEAKEWLNSQSFSTVCLLANIQPQVVRHMFDKVIDEGKVPEGFNIQTLKEAVFGKKVNAKSRGRKKKSDLKIPVDIPESLLYNSGI